MSSRDFNLLLESRSSETPQREQRDTVLDLPPDADPVQAADALESFFIHEPTAETVILAVGGSVLGNSSRARLIALGSQVLRATGDADGATLPGESLNYRILRYVCPECGYTTARVHVDARSAPQCPKGHGTLDLQP